VADAKPEKSPPWTLGAIRERGMRLEAACKTAGCGQFVVFDLERLIAQIGSDYALPDGGAGMTCEKCGADLKFQLAVWHSDHDGTGGE
jgi:hypothetical protein